MSYEAICEGDRIRWIGPRPSTGTVNVRMTILEKNRGAKEEVRTILDETYGLWGSGKMVDEIDRELETERRAWDRR